MYPSPPIFPLNRRKWEEKYEPFIRVEREISNLPPAHQQYKPVTAEDFAKVMSENTVYQYAVWYGMELALMNKMGFVICKKTM